MKEVGGPEWVHHVVHSDRGLLARIIIRKRGETTIWVYPWTRAAAISHGFSPSEISSLINASQNEIREIMKTHMRQFVRESINHASIVASNRTKNSRGAIQWTSGENKTGKKRTRWEGMRDWLREKRRKTIRLFEKKK